MTPKSMKSLNESIRRIIMSEGDVITFKKRDFSDVIKKHGFDPAKSSKTGEVIPDVYHKIPHYGLNDDGSPYKTIHELEINPKGLSDKKLKWNLWDSSHKHDNGGYNPEDLDKHLSSIYKKK